MDPPAATSSAHDEWRPKRTLAECDQIITAPGALHEMEQVTIEGRVLRAYKNLPVSIRSFWLDRAAEWRSRDYIVYESERYTYEHVRERASKLASLLYTTHAVRKGDRVAIIMRNYPEFMVAFWAISLLGGVATLVNAWAPPPTLLHCLLITNPKVAIVDPERADRLSGALLDEVKQKTSLHKVFVVRGHNSGAKWKWKDMSPLEDALDAYLGPEETWQTIEECSPEDNATIFFTSGTTGLPKGVLSSHRGFLTNLFNIIVASMRATLRKGENIAESKFDDPQKGYLLSVPLFHTTGLTSIAIVTTAIGGKIALIRKWDKEEAARIIERERLTAAGGVPSMVMDLIESSLDPSALENLGCGGAPSAETMPKEVQRRFKNVDPSQGYGLSETNATAVNIHGEDFLIRPTSTGLACPVNDLVVVDVVTQKVLPPGEVGELWIRGPNVMKGYWADKAATDNAITRDGWFKSGDSAVIDEEGFVYIKDRIKDIIIRGGENIHSTEVENALYADNRILDAAVVSVPDRRLGELVAAVVATKVQFHGQVSEESVIEFTRRILPSYAVPVMVLVQEEQIERNANGKIMKDVLRKRVRKEWFKRLEHKIESSGRNTTSKL